MNAVAAVLLLSVAGAGTALAGPMDVTPLYWLPSAAQQGAPGGMPDQAVQGTPSTPKAAVKWHQIEALRRANRDRALEMRQRLILEGSAGGGPVRPPKKNK